MSNSHSAPSSTPFQCPLCSDVGQGQDPTSFTVAVISLVTLELDNLSSLLTKHEEHPPPPPTPPQLRVSPLHPTVGPPISPTTPPTNTWTKPESVHHNQNDSRPLQARRARGGTTTGCVEHHQRGGGAVDGQAHGQHGAGVLWVQREFELRALWGRRGRHLG